MAEYTIHTALNDIEQSFQRSLGDSESHCLDIVSGSFEATFCKRPDHNEIAYYIHKGREPLEGKVSQEVDAQLYQRILSIYQEHFPAAIEEV